MTRSQMSSESGSSSRFETSPTSAAISAPLKRSTALIWRAPFFPLCAESVLVASEVLHRTAQTPGIGATISAEAVVDGPVVGAAPPLPPQPETAHERELVGDPVPPRHPSRTFFPFCPGRWPE